MKYIDAEKLKKEIEKRIKSAESCPFIEAEFGAEMRREGKTQTYNELLSLIASLQQEQPEVDLDKEIEMYISSKGLRDYAFLVPSIARYFYELGLKARKEE